MVSSGAVSPQGFGKDLVFEDIQFGEVRCFFLMLNLLLQPLDRYSFFLLLLLEAIRTTFSFYTGNQCFPRQHPPTAISQTLVFVFYQDDLSSTPPNLQAYFIKNVIYNYQFFRLSYQEYACFSKFESF